MILGVTIFYNDGAELLGNCLRSLKKVTDRVLAIDGAYKEFPHKDFKSNPETLAVAEQLADEVIPAQEWVDETAKRNAYLTLKSPKDYYLMLDGDETIEGEKPSKLKHPVYRISLSTQKDGIWMPAYYNRLFRHHKGMAYIKAHNNLLLKDGTSLSLPEPHIPIYEGLKILHTPEKRPKERQEDDGIFENTKEERNFQIPVNQKTPLSDFKETPICLRYNGERIYHGFDGHAEVQASPRSLVYVSRKKAEQLQKDFPKDWVLVKDLEA